MVSAHDPENGPGTSGPGNSRPSLTRPRKPAGIAADQQVSRLVTPDTTEKPGRSEYQDNQPGISDKSYQAKRRTQHDLRRDLRRPSRYIRVDSSAALSSAGVADQAEPSLRVTAHAT